MNAKLKLSVSVITFLFVSHGMLGAGDLAQIQGATGSRVLEQALRFYSNGMDIEAMERFMDILVKGSPSEKALATEYISKINMRLNNELRPMPGTGRPDEEGIGRGAPGAPAYPKPLEAEGSALAGVTGLSPEETDLLDERIRSKMDQLRGELLWRLGEINGVKVYEGAGGLKAIVLDPAVFFDGTGKATLRPGVSAALDLLSGLIFTAGNANCLVLPEGTALEEVSLGGIRRAMALYSYLESRGHSAARMEVRLTGTSISLPKEVMDVSGIIVLFDYLNPPKLKIPEDNRGKGPKVSLGIYPAEIRTKSNEGAVVEFSVQERAGVSPEWKFEIFGMLKDGTRLPLREISGSGARFSQTYWNGRRRFFGAAYPAGKYIFKVTAVDLDGHEVSVSRKLVVEAPQ